MYRIPVPVCLVIVLMAAASAASRLHAHHAFAAEFDATKQVKLVGTVVQMEWVNPHAWLTIDVREADDPNQIGQWGLEFGPPNILFRQGWRKNMLLPGMKITATGSLAKDGRKVANAARITLPDGKSLNPQNEIRQSSPAPETPQAR